MRDEHYLIAFESINHANYLENELRKYGHRVDIVQTPEHLTNDYYIALKVSREALEVAYEKIIEINIDRFRIYKHFTRNGKKSYKVVMKNDEEHDKDLLEMFFDQENKGNQVNVRKERLMKALDKIDSEEVRKKEIIIAKDDVKEKETLRDKENSKETKVMKSLKSNKKKNQVWNRKKLDPIKLIEGLYELRQKKNRIK